MRIHVLLSCVTFALAQTQFAVPANSTNWVASSAGNSVVLALHGIPSSINLVPLTNVAVTSLPVRDRAESIVELIITDYGRSMDQATTLVCQASLSMETALQQWQIT